MIEKTFAIIEIGSNNTKMHVYKNGEGIAESNTTIEFKKHYQESSQIVDADLEQLFFVVQSALEYTNDVHIYGCSIFRNIKKEELTAINQKLYEKFQLEIEVVSQEDEALFTALGCYSHVDYDGNLCIFIGGGGSIELMLVRNKQIVSKKYYPFGVVDITKKYSSLKEDVPSVSFDEVYASIDELIGDLDFSSEVLILAGGDHLYWYHNAGYELVDNSLYSLDSQKYMLTREMSDRYDHDAFVTSLDKIRERSDNPLWFDGSRAMKVITNLISHKVDAKYIIPTKINMEDGLKDQIMNTNS